MQNNEKAGSIHRFSVIFAQISRTKMVSDLIYNQIKETSVTGRYVTNEHVSSFLSSNAANVIGKSVEGRAIHCITLGTGTQKILMWSQMHGNESTTTKAVLDLINYLKESDLIGSTILANCTIKIIPILNPDGAYAYTRFNANQVDLNRDAQVRSQPESKILRTLFESFNPDFCFNLHDQRTIYNVGETNKPATISFLAPAHNEERTISESRGTSMKLIVAMNQVLQRVIPGQIGRYDDAFNANCVGDTFQMLSKATILFEAGHFDKDYKREKTREYILRSLIAGLNCIAKNEIDNYNRDDYSIIPENQKLFFDVLVKNANLINPALAKDIGILFTEVLKDGKIHFEPKIEKQGNLSSYFGHETYECENAEDLKRLKSTIAWNLITSNFE